MCVQEQRQPEFVMAVAHTYTHAHTPSSTQGTQLHMVCVALFGYVARSVQQDTTAYAGRGKAAMTTTTQSYICRRTR